MASTSNTTMLSDLFVPEVVADVIDKKLTDGIRLAPLAKISYDLVGRAGDELTLPSYAYIGDATQVSEGQDIPIAKLTQSTDKVKVAKYGRAVQFTDEALLAGNANDVAEEAAKQVVTSINSSVETTLLTSMANNATLKYTATSSWTDGATEVAKALEKFGEDIDGEKVIVVPPSFYSSLIQSKLWIPNTEAGAEIAIKGSVGSVYGTQIVLSNRLTASNKAYIVKPGALAIYMKRDTLVEFDRDKIDQTNYIIASKLFAPYVYDTSKLIEITL